MTLSRRAATFASFTRARSLVAAALLALILPGSAFAWSEAGHIAIAEYAMQRLSKQERDPLNALAATLANQNSEAKDTVNSRYGNVSAVASTASWLDKMRGQDVHDIFKVWGERLPRALADYGSRSTDDWHYDNQPWHEDMPNNVCSEVNGGRLNRVMPLLIEAFADVDDPRDKAIVMAMLVHLVADAHQPLHSITRVDGSCQHDRGGNGFCVARVGGDCKRNLHQHWDRGFGVFDGKLRDGLRVIASASVSDDFRFRPKAWQEENLSLAGKVYPSSGERVNDPSYLREGRRITLQRAKLAGERLAVLLSQLAGDVKLETAGSLEQAGEAQAPQ